MLGHDLTDIVSRSVKSGLPMIGLNHRREYSDYMPDIISTSAKLREYQDIRALLVTQGFIKNTESVYDGVQRLLAELDQANHLIAVAHRRARLQRPSYDETNEFHND